MGVVSELPYSDSEHLIEWCVHVCIAYEDSKIDDYLYRGYTLPLATNNKQKQQQHSYLLLQDSFYGIIGDTIVIYHFDYSLGVHRFTDHLLRISKDSDSNLHH